MTRKKVELTHDILLEYLHYHESGNLIWKKCEAAWINPGDFAGSLREDGYSFVGLLGKQYLLHRLIYYYHKLEMPTLVDHIDLNPRNNKIDNLRKANKRINSLNRLAPKNSSSGKAGVSWDNQNQKWTVRWKNSETGVYEFHGYFLLLNEAIKIREDLERKEASLWARISG